MLISQINDNFDYYFKDIKNVVSYARDNRNIKTALSKYDQMDLKDQISLKYNIDDYLRNVNIFKSHINDILIIGSNGFQENLPGSLDLSTYVKFIEGEWLREYYDPDELKFYFTPPHYSIYYPDGANKTLVISAVLPVFINQKFSGFIQGDIDYNKMKKLMNTVYSQNEIDIILLRVPG